mgnify:CR=1 FL=1
MIYERDATTKKPSVLCLAPVVAQTRIELTKHGFSVDKNVQLYRLNTQP